MIIELTKQEYVFSACIGVQRRVASQMRGDHETRENMKRKTHAERFFYNVCGSCGECAVGKAINQYWHASVDAPKEDPDVGRDIQSRCYAEAWYDLIIRDDDPQDHRYVLIIGEPPDFDIKGWIHGAEARTHNEWYRKDDPSIGQPSWWIPQSALHAPELLVREGELLVYAPRGNGSGNRNRNRNRSRSGGDDDVVSMFGPAR